jgi:hypothetical protein
MGWVVSVTPRPLFTPGERTAGTHWTGGWVGPRAGLNTEVRGTILLPLPGIEPRLPGRPVRSQTLYWLSNPSSPLTVCLSKIFRHWVTEAEWSYVTPAFPHGLAVVSVDTLASNKMPITVWICRLTAIYFLRDGWPVSVLSNKWSNQMNKKFWRELITQLRYATVVRLAVIIILNAGDVPYRYNTRISYIFKPFCNCVSSYCSLNKTLHDNVATFVHPHRVKILRSSYMFIHATICRHSIPLRNSACLPTEIHQ